jgi:hypothetical protein
MTSIIGLQVTLHGGEAMHVLLDDELGRLALRRLRPWHRVLARGLAVSLDRQLAKGTPPEANALLAARAMYLTSTEYRSILAAGLRRILAASVSQQARPRPALSRASAGVARQPHVPLRQDRIAGSAAELARLAGRLTQRGPVPARGVAMVSQLLTDGGGPLYRAASRDDLDAVIERAAQALLS